MVNLSHKKLQDPIAKRIKLLGFITHEHSDKARDAPIYVSPAYMKQQALPGQGFKIHVSATFINSPKIFDRIIPYLLDQHIAFKVIATNKLLRLFNEDRFGYTQVGKFITIYPRDVPHFVDLIHQLDKKLINFEAPIIPSDLRLHEKSVVYYRYGVIANPNMAELIQDLQILHAYELQA